MHCAVKTTDKKVFFYPFSLMETENKSILQPGPRLLPISQFSFLSKVFLLGQEGLEKEEGGK